MDRRKELYQSILTQLKEYSNAVSPEHKVDLLTDIIDDVTALRDVVALDLKD